MFSRLRDSMFCSVLDPFCLRWVLDAVGDLYRRSLPIQSRSAQVYSLQTNPHIAIKSQSTTALPMSVPRIRGFSRFYLRMRFWKYGLFSVPDYFCPPHPLFAATSTQNSENQGGTRQPFFFFSLPLAEECILPYYRFIRFVTFSVAVVRPWDRRSIRQESTA